MSLSSVQPDPPNPHPEFPTGPPRGAQVALTSTLTAYAAQIEDVRALLVENKVKVLAAALPEDDHRGVVTVTVVLEHLPAFR